MTIKALRKEIKSSQKTFVPGINPEIVKKKYHLDSVIRIGSNENPYGPFPNAIEAMKDEINFLNTYPGNTYMDIKTLIGKNFGVSADHVALGQGATGVLEAISKIFIEEGDEVIIPKQSYRVYVDFSAIMGGVIKELEVDDTYTINLKNIQEAITPKTKLIWLCNPNNPSGTLVDKNDFDKLIESLPEHCWLILDEAYGEFADQSKLPEKIKHIASGKNMLFTRTFSKYYGLAGSRIGYIVASPEIISAFETVSQPFTINRIALIGALASMTKDKVACEEAMTKIVNERIRTENEIRKLGLEVTTSNTNFIFIKTLYDTFKFASFFGKNGIVIRPTTAWGYKKHIRVSVGTREDMDAFLKYLKIGLENPDEVNACS